MNELKVNNYSIPTIEFNYNEIADALLLNLKTYKNLVVTEDNY